MASETILKIVLNSLSVVSCLSLCCYLLSKERRQYLPSFLIGHILLNSCIFSGVVLILASANYWPANAYLSNFVCELFRTILIFTKNANALWSTAIALTTYYIMIQKDLSFIEHKCVYIVYGLAALPTLLFFILFWDRVKFDPNDGQTCVWDWNSSSGMKWRDSVFTVCFSFIPLIACIASLILYYLAIRRLRELHRVTTADLMVDQLEALKIRMYYMIGYPIVIFITVLMAVFMYAVWHDIKSETVQNGIDWIFYSCVGAQGLIEAIIYVSNWWFSQSMKRRQSQHHQLAKRKRNTTRSREKSTISSKSSRSSNKSKSKGKRNNKQNKGSLKLTSSSEGPSRYEIEPGKSGDVENLQENLLENDFQNEILHDDSSDHDLRMASDLSDDTMDGDSNPLANTEFTTSNMNKVNRQIQQSLSQRDNVSKFV